MNGMSDKTFVDTNVLIYAHDVDATAKHETARTVLRDLWSQRTGVLSMQVLQEFYVNVTRKIATPLSKGAARLVVNSYSIWCVETTPSEIAAAFHQADYRSLPAIWTCLVLFYWLKAIRWKLLLEPLGNFRPLRVVYVIIFSECVNGF